MMKVDFQTWITFKILWGNGTFAPLRVMDTLLKNEVRSNPDESLDLELLEMSIVSKKSLWKEPANQVEDSLLFIARIVSRYAQTTLCQTTVSCLKVKCLAVAFTRCVSHHRSYKSQNAFSNKKECCIQHCNELLSNDELWNSLFGRFSLSWMLFFFNHNVKITPSN
jgi:hypothetical protein